jgi:hypothetical protein
MAARAKAKTLNEAQAAEMIGIHPGTFLARESLTAFGSETHSR